MKRHDIRLRKEAISSRRIQRHKDFGKIMQEHQRINGSRNVTRFLTVIVSLGLIGAMTYWSIPKRDKVVVNAPEKFNFKTERYLIKVPSLNVKAVEDNGRIISVLGASAEPQGGHEAYLEYLSNNLEYPELAVEDKVSGVVLVQFRVLEDSTISDFRIIKNLGFECDEEAVRLIQNGPKWIPGKIENIVTHGVMIVPVTFQLP
ncbi:energy transducer TonB [Fulvivirgaceae bacterium BMA10]|uniref:Energy transducer TonB n=1 Tax=Splendidivirga corallicola TaxID=3051826 RepID=A0ABT8KRZ4_9BACT|nr:energy transducer TonB [Fulvivirgaceae bacterium BMA10]